MSKKKPVKPFIDIFQTLTEADEEEERERRQSLLEPLNVKDFFPDGRITINQRTCQGVECKLCIKVCPTNALYWKAGEVGVTKELCIYCGACVLACIVDDCIKIVRRRSEGGEETFSKPADFIRLQHDISSEKRFQRAKNILPNIEHYIKQHETRKKHRRRSSNS